MPLSDRQLAAAHRLGQDVCVVAGPGSGKTSVLIERFSWLVRERGVHPSRILAITFTEKAATEIRERMLRAFSDTPHLRSQVERAWVSTIHAFCSRLLRENAIEAGIDPEFTILEQSWLVLQEVADQVLEERFAADPPRMRRFLRSLAVAQERDGFVPDLATSLVEIYDAVRLAGASLAELRQQVEACGPHFDRILEIAWTVLKDKPACKKDTQFDEHEKATEWAKAVAQLDPGNITPSHIALASRANWNKNNLVKGSAAREHESELRDLLKDLRCDWTTQYYAPERETIVEVLERIDEVYRECKRRASVLDFDDLEEAAIHLLGRSPELRAKLAAGFDYILMDELQDTNPLQWKLMELVRRDDNFFAVGDINQSIYGFRHARPELFGGYRDRLRESGRHVDELRDNYRTRSAVLDVVNRIFHQAVGIEPHTLVSAADFAPKQTESVEVMVAHGEATAETEWMEAQWVAQRILELTTNFRDVAILTRANDSTGDLQRALDKFGVPSVVVGGKTFYDTREVRDLKLALDVLVNPNNEVALAGLLRSPVFGLTDEDLMRLTAAGEGLRRGVDREPPVGWDLILELRAQRNQISPDRLLRRLIDACDYEHDLTSRARSNVGKFLTMVRERYERNPVPLAELVTSIEQASPEAEAPPSESGNAVRLMTLHKAKGLEFPIVFIPYLHKGRNYGTPVISYTHEHGLGVKWRNPSNAENVPDTISKANADAANAAADAEENRLLYVGCTRAKEHLVLSWSATERENTSWAKFLKRQLAITIPPPDTAEVRENGLRIFSTAQAPRPAAGLAAAALAPPARILDPVDDSASPDSAASVTDVSRFDECPRRFYLGRFLGIGRPQRPDLLVAEEENLWTGDNPVSAADLGVQVHALLAGQQPPDASPEARELAAKFANFPVARYLKKSVRRAHEWDFVFETAGLVLRGQIDLWFETDRDLVLVDYKTDRNPDQRAIDAHSLQLRIYALALGKALGRRPTRAVLAFLRSGTEHEVDLSPLFAGEALEAVHRFRDAQRSGRFPLQPGEHCRSCEFYLGACPVERERRAAG